MDVVLIRHAESIWNADGRWQGQADPALSDDGRRQARELSRQLADQGIQVLVTSDLRRAHETARILGAGLGLEPILDPRFRELDVGEWSGLTGTQIESRDPERLARFRAGDPDVAAGGAETRREIRRRTRRAAADLLRAHPDRKVALVTHLGVLRALLPGCELPNAGWRTALGSELSGEPPAGVGCGGRRRR